MALNGTGFRLVSTTTHVSGRPGGAIDIMLELVPTGNYPANGELISDVKAAIGDGFTASTKPDWGYAVSNLGHLWTLDKTQGAMGSLRNWTAIGNTPTEHVGGAYAGNEASSVVYVFLRFPLYGSMSR